MYSQAGSGAPSSLPQAICQGVRADRRCQSQVCWRASSLRPRPASTLPRPAAAIHMPTRAAISSVCKRRSGWTRAIGVASSKAVSSRLQPSWDGRQLSQSWRWNSGLCVMAAPQGGGCCVLQAARIAVLQALAHRGQAGHGQAGTDQAGQQIGALARQGGQPQLQMHQALVIGRRHRGVGKDQVQLPCQRPGRGTRGGASSSAYSASGASPPAAGALMPPCRASWLSTRPPRRLRMWVQYSSSSLRMWLETIRVMPWACSARISRDRLARASGSRPLAGSSSSSTRGWWTMAWPMATRWRWPRDSSVGRRSSRSARPSCPATCATRCGAGRGTPMDRAAYCRQRRAQAVIEAEEIRQIAQVPVHFAGLLLHGNAMHLDLARQRLVQPGDAAHQRGFSGAVGPHQGRDGACGDMDADAVQRAVARVLEHQLRNLDQGEPSLIVLMAGRNGGSARQYSPALPRLVPGRAA